MTYDYVLPGAFGNPLEFVLANARDVDKQVAGLPNLIARYAWDGVRAYRSGITNTSTWSIFDVVPKITQPSTTTTVATSMTILDVFADSKARLFVLHIETNPNGSSGNYLTVSDAAGNRLYQGLLSDQGGDPRIFEDSKNRLWLLIMWAGPNGASAKLLGSTTISRLAR
jgi:hypothetical protein